MRQAMRYPILYLACLFSANKALEQRVPERKWMRPVLWSTAKRSASARNHLFRPCTKRSTYSGIHNIKPVERQQESLQGINTSAWRPVLFALLVGGGTFAWSAERTNYDTSAREEMLRANSKNKSLVAMAWGNSNWPNSDDLNRSRVEDTRQHLIKLLRWSKQKTQELARATIIVGEGWISTPEAKRTCYGLLAVQSVVFLAWQTRRLQPFMMRNFLSHPLSNRTYTNLTSVFSHNSLLHFGFNSIAFLSIGTSAHVYLWNLDRNDEMKSSTARYEFLAFFVAGGLMASATSQVWTLAVKLPRLLKQNATPSIEVLSRAVLPSLGASGAIWSCLSVTALAFPDAEVQLIFLPFFSFPITYGVGAMAALDLAGLIFRWRMFDHAAHLGGAVFGALYYYYGHDLFMALRKLLGGQSVQKV